MNTAFRLSRIYAEGWNAAKALPENEREDLDNSDVQVRNPYPSDPERSRWSEGFTKALGN